MKIGTITKLKIREVFVPLGEPAEGGEVLGVCLRAPRLDAVQRLRKEIPQPKPPNNGIVLRDDRGLPKTDEMGLPIVGVNLLDPAYLAEKERAGKAHTLALILECMKDAEPRLEFDAQREDCESTLDYYEAVWKEMEDFGIDILTFARLAEGAASMAGITTKELREAREALAPKAGANGSG